MQIVNKKLSKKIITIRDDISEIFINGWFKSEYGTWKGYNGIDSNILKNGLYRFCWWGLHIGIHIDLQCQQLNQKLNKLLKNHKYKDIIDSYKLKMVNGRHKFTIYFKIDEEILIDDYYKMFVQLQKDIEKIKNMKKRLNNINDNIKRGILKKDIEGRRFIHDLVKNQTFDMWKDVIQNKEESWVSEYNLDPDNFKNEEEYNHVIEYLSFRDKY